MSHLAQILFSFYIFIFALNQERKTVSVKEYAYDIIYINLKCPNNIIKLLVAVFLKVLIFGHFPLIQVLNGLFQEEQFSSLNAVQNAVFIPKERPNSFRTAVLNGRLAKNHDCRSER